MRGSGRSGYTCRTAQEGRAHSFICPDTSMHQPGKLVPWLALDPLFVSLVSLFELIREPNGPIGLHLSAGMTAETISKARLPICLTRWTRCQHTVRGNRHVWHLDTRPSNRWGILSLLYEKDSSVRRGEMMENKT
jgi:hypothetical protein